MAKRNIPVETNQTQTVPVIKEPEKNPDFEMAIDELQNLYPQGTEGIECRIYKELENNSKAFVKKLDYFPDEAYLQTNYGAGTFFLYCYIFIDGKRKFLKSPKVKIFNVENSVSVNVQEQKPEVNNIDLLLSQLKAFRDAGIIPQNGNNANGNDAVLTILGNMVIESNKTNKELMMRIADVKPEKSGNDKILEILLAKALDKSDPLKEVDTFLKIKESFAGEPAPSGEGDFLGSIAKYIPAFLALAQTDKSNAIPLRQSTLQTQRQIPVKQPNLKQIFLTALKDPDIRNQVKNIINEYDEENETETENTNGVPGENLSDNVPNSMQEQQTQDGSTDNSNEENPGNVYDSNGEINNNLNNNNQNMNLAVKAQAEAIKLASEETKIKILSNYLEQMPYKIVMDFCIEYEIVPDKNTFDLYVTKAGYAIPIEYNEETMTSKL